MTNQPSWPERILRLPAHLLLLVLIFLPFQLHLVNQPWIPQSAGGLLRYLDEAVIALLLPLALVAFVWKRRDAPELCWHLGVVVLFATVAAISGLVNTVPIFPLLAGTFDYIKNLMVVFLFAAFFKGESSFNAIRRLVVLLGVLMAAVAVYQQLVVLVRTHIPWELATRELLFCPPGIPIHFRLGFFRTPGFCHHPNTLGLFLVLALTLYIFTARKTRPAVFLLLFSGIIFSGSRMAYTCLLVLLAAAFLRGKRWAAAAAVPPLILIFLIVLPRSHQPSPERVSLRQTKKIEYSFRTYSRKLGLRIWRDHPWFGVGPGRFGGVVSLKYPSPVYREYEMKKHWFNYMKKFNSLDQFWPQILAELGTLGTLSFLFFLLTPAGILFRRLQRSPVRREKDLYLALLLPTLYIFVYSLGSGLNVAPFLFTYMGLLGVGLTIHSTIRTGSAPSRTDS